MTVKFNNKNYKKNGRNGLSLRDLCFDIFQQYLKQNTQLNYIEVQNVFNEYHCNNNFVVLSQQDWEQKTNNLRNRYFEPIDYNSEKLYFTTQWGNNGGACDNINKIINFAQVQGYNIEILEDSVQSKSPAKNKNVNIKNIILYGAPGVGKTHNYKRLISMIEDCKSQQEIFSNISANKEVDDEYDNTFQNIKDDKRVEFVTFHQSYSYEDFIEGFRPTEKDTIELEDGIFKRLSINALNQIREVENKHITFEDAFDILRTQYIDEELEQLYTVRHNEILINNFQDRSMQVKSKDAKNWQYIKKSDLETVVHAILNNTVVKPVDIKKLNVKKDTISLAGYYFPIGTKIAEIIKENKIDVETEKNFYIVIDEINRGNISKIFGELITLIEEDKRDKYEVTLPYSKEKFKIPSNLYIIATMNSTDKSIATIDIALRRRFTFLKMKPNLELVENPEAKELMEKLNTYIQDKLGEDYMLGHSYFMGDDVDLKFIKEYKIKPLLEEYFYSDDKTPDEIIIEALEYKE
ncbi:MAG: AAA family ATPase [Campylobacterota bacterium]|nr:AAA family ATPase [Campylobacterota bacterium]